MKGNNGNRSFYSREAVLIANKVQCEALRRSPEYKAFYAKLPKDSIDKKTELVAFDAFGVLLLLLQIQGYDSFFDPDKEWPKECILFPEYMAYIEIENKTVSELFPGLFDEVKIVNRSHTTAFDELARDHEIIAIPKTLTNRKQIIKILTDLINDVPQRPFSNMFMDAMKIGKNRVVATKEGTMRQVSAKMLEYFKWRDYYIEQNMGRTPSGNDREGYGRVAKHFNITKKKSKIDEKERGANSAVKMGLKRANDAIEAAGKGELLYPIIAGKRNSIERSAEVKLTNDELKNKIMERQKRIDAFNKMLKRKRVEIDQDTKECIVLPSIEEEKKIFNKFLDKLNVPVLNIPNGTKLLKLKK